MAKYGLPPKGPICIYTMTHFLIPLVILTFCLASPTLGYSKTGVHVTSRLPNYPAPLQVRCQSGDNDLGMHTLRTNEELTWRFTPNIWQTTLFFCHFYWGSKNRSFAVYNNRLRRDYCHNRASRVCDYYWLAKEDAFFISTDNQTWEKVNNW